MDNKKNVILRECVNCKNKNTMDCPNSFECYSTIGQTILLAKGDSKWQSFMEK